MIQNTMIYDTNNYNIIYINNDNTYFYTDSINNTYNTYNTKKATYNTFY